MAPGRSPRNRTFGRIGFFTLTPAFLENAATSPQERGLTN